MGKANLGCRALVAMDGMQTFPGPERPITTGMVNKGAAIRLRPSQHFVAVGVGVLGSILPGSILRIGVVIQTRDDFAFLRECRQLVHVVA